MESFSGKCSWFGGPKDHGMTPDEGLALFEPIDIPHYPKLFLPEQPKGLPGISHRLNPDTFYLAMRWDYIKTPREWLRDNTVTVSALKTNKSAIAYPVDWGPNIATGRIADLSYGLLTFLGIETDDVVIVEIMTPEEGIGTVSGKIL